MKGFDPEFTDIVDYILKITYRIWEENGMGLIYSYYAPNVTVHTPHGVVRGREQMLADSVFTLSSLPDRRLFAEDVIWSGNPEDGFHTSHRIVTVGHNNGYSAFGPPTGRKVVYRTIANCLVRDNRIVEEWLIRDGLSVVRQLGFDEGEVVRKLAADRAAADGPVGSLGRVKGQSTPETLPPPAGTGGFDVEDFVRRSLHEVWNWRLFNKVDEYYADDYECYVPTDRRLQGREDFRRYVIATVATLPDAEMTVDHVYWLGNDRDGYRVAARWTLLGTHDRPGIHGNPTGRRVEIMGITHYYIRDGVFRKEWTVFDELAVLAQLRPEPSDGAPEEAGTGASGDARVAGTTSGLRDSHSSRPQGGTGERAG